MHLGALEQLPASRMRWNSATSMKDSACRRSRRSSGRVVTETDSEMLGSCSKMAREMEDLPAPEGEASTIITPRRRELRHRPTQVLDLLAELVDDGLEVKADRRQLHGVGLGAQGIRLRS